MLTCDKVLVQPIHRLHVGIIDGKAANITVLNDPRLLDALGQRHVAMLQAPPHQQLPWRARVFLGEGDYGWMLHFQCPNKRSICLDHDIVLLAERGDVLPRVEWVGLHLIHRRKNPRLGIQELLYLEEAPVSSLYGLGMHVEMLSSRRATQPRSSCEVVQWTVSCARRKAT